MALRFDAHRRPLARVVVAMLLCLASLVVGEAGPSLQGFGASTRGGSDGATVRVTTLNDAGPGSLRQALSGGSRTVVFDVAGEILLQDHLFVKAFVTIDGFTAPPPGITLRGYGLVIRGGHGAHDVIVRGVRIRHPAVDGIQIQGGAYNVVIDHVSVSGAGDGDIDITKGAHDVTVSWSILAEPVRDNTMLIKYDPARVTLHHNLFVKGRFRHPYVAMATGQAATDTTLDMRNNVIWDWGTGWGTFVHDGARANVVANFYGSPASPVRDRSRALIVERGAVKNFVPARAYVRGNVSGDLTRDLNAAGTEPRAFEASPVETEDACVAARRVLDGAGARPLDDIDTRYLAPIAILGCKAPAPLGVPTGGSGAPAQLPRLG